MNEQRKAELDALFAEQNTVAAKGKVSNPERIQELDTLFDQHEAVADESIVTDSVVDQALGPWGQFKQDMQKDFQQNIGQLSSTFEGLGGDMGTPADQMVSPGEAAWQIAANPINFMFDTAGNTLKLAGTSVYSTLPPEVQNKTQAGLNYIKNSHLFQAATDALNAGAEAWASFEQANPQTAKTLAGGADIYGMFAGGPKPIKPMPEVELTPTKIRGLGQRNEAAPPVQQDKFLYNLQREEVTADNVGQVDQPRGVNRQEEAIPTPAEWDTIDALKKTSVSPNKTKRQNLHAVGKRIEVLARQLEAKGKDVNADVPGMLNDMNNRVGATMQQNPGWGKNRMKRAQPLIAQAEQILAKYPNTAEGILKARREFDSWAEGEYGKDVFTGNKLKVRKETIRSIRDAMNTELARVMPDSVDSLREQHLLYRARNNMAPRAAQEANSAIGRLVQNTKLALPHTPLGIFMTGVAATSLPPAVLLGGALAIPPLALGGVLAKRGLRTPAIYNARTTSVIAMKNLLKETNKALAASRGNKQMLRQLKADRAILVGLIHEMEAQGVEEVPEDG